ncbi:hypothetical protein DFJ74DRAFT_395962 [Hyaloraphidium curvatum]|nr:hypothetical protein DFJ74DRAFT_395962 [Hyaloraphidium curvatum]
MQRAVRSLMEAAGQAGQPVNGLPKPPNTVEARHVHAARPALPHPGDLLVARWPCRKEGPHPGPAEAVPAGGGPHGPGIPRCVRARGLQTARCVPAQAEERVPDHRRRGRARGPPAAIRGIFKRLEASVAEHLPGPQGPGLAMRGRHRPDPVRQGHGHLQGAVPVNIRSCECASASQVHGRRYLWYIAVKVFGVVRGQILWRQRHIRLPFRGRCRICERRRAGRRMAESRLAKRGLAERRLTKCRLAKCRLAKCRLTECRLAESGGLGSGKSGSSERRGRPLRCRGLSRGRSKRRLRLLVGCALERRSRRACGNGSGALHSSSALERESRTRWQPGEARGSRRLPERKGADSCRLTCSRWSRRPLKGVGGTTESGRSESCTSASHRLRRPVGERAARSRLQRLLAGKRWCGMQSTSGGCRSESPCSGRWLACNCRSCKGRRRPERRLATQQSARHPRSTTSTLRWPQYRRMRFAAVMLLTKTQKWCPMRRWMMLPRAPATLRLSSTAREPPTAAGEAGGLERSLEVGQAVSAPCSPFLCALRPTAGALGEGGTGKHA